MLKQRQQNARQPETPTYPKHKHISPFPALRESKGALLNNSNGCPRMPIRNTTAIKAMSILGAEWRPLQQMKALFLLSSGGCSSTSISPSSACRRFISLFILPEQGEMFGF